MGRVESPLAAGIRLSVLLFVASLTACDDGGLVGSPADRPIPDLTCSIPESLIYPGANKDAIPALVDPAMVQPGHPSLSYLGDSDRVVGLELDGQSWAIPHNILWWHEIVNLTHGDQAVAITHCPLTGSSLVFDRTSIDGAELGVSGLLYLNNLIMYDRTDEESLWPQMSRGARCGPRDGAQLSQLPIVEMRWDAWRELNPGTLVVSGDTGYRRDYRVYPYGGYASPTNSQILYPMPEIDDRRQPKEPVLGIPDGEGGGIAFPFGELDAGPVYVAEHELGRRTIVVLWSREAVSAMAYLPEVDGRPVTLEVEDGRIIDVGTGSVWTVQGHAIEGPLVHDRLAPIPAAYMAYWFAWAAFHPDTEIWERP